MCPQFDLKVLNKNVREAINGCKLVILNENDTRRKAILVSSPTLPWLYGLPKLHKQRCPLRSVVSYISYPAYLLAKYSDRWFKHHVDIYFDYAIQNSFDLTNKIERKNSRPSPGNRKVFHIHK